MKKLLSLLLAVLMTASLLTVGASAAGTDKVILIAPRPAAAATFTDQATFAYPEAVAKIAELGIVGGYGDGSFGAKGTLSRGAAAKIICGMMLTADELASLPPDSNPYPDVPAGSTFVSYVAYLQEKDVIGGYADGTFKPSNKLSAVAFLKMLMGALGYSAEIEGFYGATGSAKILAKAATLGLTRGYEGRLNVDSGCTREEACLFAFNALECQMVRYRGGLAFETGKTYLETRTARETLALDDYAVEPGDISMAPWFLQTGIKPNGSAVYRFIPTVSVDWDWYFFSVTAENGHTMQQYRRNVLTTVPPAKIKEIGCKTGTNEVSAEAVTLNTFDQNDIGCKVNVFIEICCKDGTRYSVQHPATFSALT